MVPDHRKCAQLPCERDDLLALRPLVDQVARQDQSVAWAVMIGKQCSKLIRAAVNVADNECSAGLRLHRQDDVTRSRRVHQRTRTLLRGCHHARRPLNNEG